MGGDLHPRHDAAGCGADLCHAAVFQRQPQMPGVESPRCRVVGGDFAPGFRVDHLVKDLGIALAEAKKARLALPGLALANQLYVALQAQDRGQDGTQSLVHALSALSGLAWPPPVP